MVRNTMADLNDHLFMQLERLNDESLTQDELKAEIDRSRAVAKISQGIIANGNLILRAAEFNDEKLDDTAKLPRMLGGE